MAPTSHMAPNHPEWIPWPPTHPEWIPWPPTHPEWIPWPPQHPDWIPTNPDDLPYLPSRDNRFHLFTRANPSMSQPLIYKNNYVLAVSNFDASKRTVVLIHDLGGSATSQFNAILVPAILSAADVNVIIVDWSYGANSETALSTFYSVLSGRFVAYFIRWLSEYSNADLANFHLVGVGIGGLNAGFIGLNLRRKVGYITALDPPRGPSITSLLPPLNPNVALYTEVIHTDADESGYAQPLGDVDFYPNGGINQPGCGNDSACNRQRSVYFFAESIQTGGFTGVRCNSYRDALESNCYGSDTLQMGGLEPKTGSSGVFYVRTNALPPFSQG
ncbi:hypothetical protein ABMA28_012626 [Loxostege sticticalis]|uniref:Lipase domain-containing protein n=1 Tax=Loxostege sticticalis TaxID=481309 RepID=A0ABD0S4G5_LOXSC